MTKVYQEIARLLQAVANCEHHGNLEWKAKHRDRIAELVDTLPSGSGFDNGTKLGDDSTPNKLIFRVSFHHMNESGMYDGWTDHSVIVTSDLASGFSLRITGRDRNEIKDNIAECFHSALNEEAPAYEVKAA